MGRPVKRYHPPMQRVRVPELMDDPAIPRDELDRSLRYIRVVNRRFGGAWGLIRHLREWSARWPKGRPITLLDLGTGSADIPVAVREWGVGRGFDIRVTGVDVHETTLDLARAHVQSAGAEEISLVRGDALGLMDQFAPESFDYVHAGMFLHHLSPIEVLTVLRIMDRLGRAGLVWNDLVRSRLVNAVLGVALVGQPHIVKHDARVSVRAGFTRSEVLDAARRVGISYATYRRLMVYRFTLAGERRGA